MALSSVCGGSELTQWLSLAQSAQMDKSDADQAAKLFKDKDTDNSGGLSLEEMGGDQALFDEFDTNKDGEISPGELQAGLRKLREQAKGRADAEVNQNALLGQVQSGAGQDGGDAEGGMSESDMEALDAGLGSEILTDRDADGDGLLSAGEMGLSGDEFKALDTDGDGLLSRDELTADFTAKRQEFEARMQARGRTIPTPSGQESAGNAASAIPAGSDGTVTAAGPDSGASSAVSSEIDTNRDGVISPEELRAWLEKQDGQSGAGQDQASAPAEASGLRHRQARQAYRNQSAAAPAPLFGGDPGRNAVQGQDAFQNLGRPLSGDTGSGLSAVA